VASRRQGHPQRGRLEKAAAGGVAVHVPAELIRPASRPEATLIEGGRDVPGPERHPWEATGTAERLRGGATVPNPGD